ncbi:hypothetical protein HS7_00280 [Sulfolobales archaeon HS-7]|nr:hypothetical protein HS7_00280 [Sulfolobales archaeon HS-7]
MELKGGGTPLPQGMDIHLCSYLKYKRGLLYLNDNSEGVSVTETPRLGLMWYVSPPIIQSSGDYHVHFEV